MTYDVTIDRDKYIGGSDIPAIMGISPFKTRYALLCEKAGIVQDEFKGNHYTEYGNILEPQIRAYINDIYFDDFKPSQTISGIFRANTDGFNSEEDTVLEIKTTSQIHESVDDYRVYLVQLLFYMQINNAVKGILAVYKRPADFNPDFDRNRLQVFEIFKSDYEALISEIFAECDRFLTDLARLKENPLLTEQDFIQSTELLTLSSKVVALENEMVRYKAFKEQYEEMKQALYDAMVKADVKSWTMPNGTKITRVDGKPATAKVVEEFDVAAFKKDNEQLYKDYTKEVIKQISGRSGYAKITYPKE